MSDSFILGIASRGSSSLSRLEDIFSQEHDIEVRRLLIAEGESVPLSEEIASCDVVVCDVDDNVSGFLSAIIQKRTPVKKMIVLCQSAGLDIARQAFRSGIADFLTDADDNKAIIEAVRSVNNRRDREESNTGSDLTLFVTPKGGAGSTSLAVNLAHILSDRELKPNVLLMDMDFQYGNLPLSFGETPNTRLSNAILNNERIDSTVLDACLSDELVAPSILATYSEQLLSPWEIEPGHITDLLSLLLQSFDHILIDLPKSVDPVTYQALDRADRICIVVQQSILDMRVAQLYLKLIIDQGISRDKINLVINRFQGSHSIRLQDFQSVFEDQHITTVPNDYHKVNYAQMNSTSLVKKWRKAPITQSLLSLSDHFWPIEQIEKNEKKSIFSFRRAA